MKLENQVTSLKLSKKLKKLGVKQDSLFYYAQPSPKQNKWTEGGSEYRLFFCEGHPINKEAISAFTVAELGEIIPPQIFNKKDMKHYYYQQIGTNLGYWNSSGKSMGGMQNIEINEANARAKMLIYLIEKKLVKCSNNQRN